jgi:hypothetical protein
LNKLDKIMSTDGQTAWVIDVVTIQGGCGFGVSISKQAGLDVVDFIDKMFLRSVTYMWL